MAPKPDHSTHGQIHRPPGAANHFTKDTKTKTCKCRICGQRVEVWSWQCNLCHDRICSVCCQDDPSGSDPDKADAKDQLAKGCARERFKTGVNPKIVKMKRDGGVLPRKQEEQMRKDREAKRKAMATSAKKKTEEESKNAPALTQDETESESAEPDEGDGKPEKESPTVQKTNGKGKAPVRRSGGSSFSNIGDLEDPFGPDSSIGGKQSARLEGKKRASDAASSNHIRRPPSSLKKAKISRKRSPLDGGNTLIVGGGIVGLFAAYELALRCVRDRIDNSITVLEIRNAVCELASGQCAGFLTARGMPEVREWKRILLEAADAWKELIQQGKGGQFGFVKKDTYFAEPDDDLEGEPLPEWWQPKAIYEVLEDKETLGRLDVRMLVAWLEGECRRLGVGFLLGQYPNAVQPKTGGNGYLVSITGVEDPSQGGIKDCSHLIFTAGPYTTATIRDLFSAGAAVGLSNIHSEFIWMDVPLANRGPQDEAAVTVTTDDDWSAGTLSMVVRRGSAGIEISAATRDTGTGDVDVDKATTAPIVHWEKLKDLARPLIGGAADTAQVGSGAVVSVAEGEAPFIGRLRVPKSATGDTIEIPNIWLSYGFGRHGTTLAPGAAKVLVDGLLGP